MLEPAMQAEWLRGDLEAQVRAHADLLLQNVFGNPHSSNPTSMAMTRLASSALTKTGMRSMGAAAVMVMSAEKAAQLGLKPLARFVTFAVGGVPPELMGIGPIAAIPKALKLAGLKKEDIDLFELNEAFAAQSLAVIRTLELDQSKINVNGGAIALGHPLGCTGSKLTTQLIYEMARRKSKYGMVTMCIGGGMGGAAIFENLQN